MVPNCSSQSISESLVRISKVPAAGLFQGSVLGLQRVDEELSCFHQAGGTVGSISGGAGSLLDSTLLWQTSGNAHADKMLPVIAGRLVLPSQERTVDSFIWYLW